MEWIALEELLVGLPLGTADWVRGCRPTYLESGWLGTSWTESLGLRVIQGSSNISVPHAQSAPSALAANRGVITGVTSRNRCSRVRILKASRHKGTE
ncbi:unnamed protein product [Arctogadus glacialis]